MGVLIAISSIALVHLWEPWFLRNRLWKRYILSVGGGVSVAYVFIALLPHLSASQRHIDEHIHGLFPFLERHAYLLALFGLLFFLVIQRIHLRSASEDNTEFPLAFWVQIAAYSLLNGLIGYAVADKNDQEVRPLFFFTVAMVLHYIVVDHGLRERAPELYDRVGRWILVASLYGGGFLGLYFQLSQAAVAVIVAFIAGGIIMNVMRHELPDNDDKHLGAFLISSLLYAGLILTFA